MQTGDLLKAVPRTSRTRTATTPLTSSQSQHLERLYVNSSIVKNAHWNPSYNDTEIINERTLSVVHASHAQQRRERRYSFIDDRIVINVCGSRYETHRTTLELYPDTLLGNAKRRKYYYDKHRQEYFFDRHRACFEAILYYYQSNGRLRRPDFVPLDIFLEEVTFFQLGSEALSQIRKTENIKEMKKVRLPRNRIRRYIWATMEYLDYSFLAKVVNVISLLMVLLSTVTLAVETLPQYVHLDDLNCVQYTDSNTNNSSTPNDVNLYICPTYYTSSFFLIQAVCMGFFTIELLLRIISTPSILSFVTDLMNWIDLLAVIPFYISLAISLSGRENHVGSKSYIGLRFLRVLRLARVLKLLRVFRSIKSLRVLATTVRQSLVDFFIMITMLTLLGFLFGSAVYYAEYATNGEVFDSTLKATYWGIITITTIGYGDMTPVTPIGRVIACLCALCGTATTGILVSVLVDRYQRVYARKLFVKENLIDFDGSSDEETNDNDSRDLTFIARHRENSKIENPDARAREHVEQLNTHPNELVQTPDSLVTINENPLKRNSSQVRLISNQECSDENIPSNIIPNQQDVQFELSGNNDSTERQTI